MHNEAKYQLSFNHPNLLKLNEFIDDDNYLVFIMDLMEGGTLKDLLTQRYFSSSFFFNELEISCIMEQILMALSYLHSYSIIHRDIKPDNIMFQIEGDLYSLKIVDFGLVAEIEDEKETLFCGTIAFNSPEQIHRQLYDSSVDIFAAGFLMYILCSGGQHPLYKPGDSIESYKAKLKEGMVVLFPKTFPLLARNLFLKLCKYFPHNRYCANKALKHPFISRQPNPIPLTIIDDYGKRNMEHDFKSKLSK